MFSSAIFDMDGLLIDSERTIMDLWLRVTAELGRPLDEGDYLPVIGRRAEDSRSILVAQLGETIFEQACARVETTLLDSDPRSLFPEKPGARRLLDDLRTRGVPCAVTSSTRSVEVRHRLTGNGLLHYFSVVIGGEQVPNGKPHPDLYLLSAQCLGVEPARCLAFEDSDHGVASAVAAGIQVVLVPDIKTPSPISTSTSFAVLNTLSDAQPLLQAWFS